MTTCIMQHGVPAHTTTVLPGTRCHAVMGVLHAPTQRYNDVGNEYFGRFIHMEDIGDSMVLEI